MHGIPDEIKPELFEKRTLESVLFAERLIGFRFTDPPREEVRISLWAAVGVRPTGEADEVIEEPVGEPEPKASELVGAVGRKVEAVAIDAEAIRLGLSDGYELRFFDSSSRFESFMVIVGEGDEIVV